MSLYSVLAVRCSSDLLLHHLSAIGLAASKGTALLVDLDEQAAAYPGLLTIADLVREGVRRTDLGPLKEGVAVLGRGGADLERSVELVEALRHGWPSIVIRAGAEPLPFPIVPVVPIYPAGFGHEPERAVRQPVIRTKRTDNVTLPRLRRSQVSSMLAGHVQPRWRWVRAWAEVWDRSWD